MKASTVLFAVCLIAANFVLGDFLACGNLYDESCYNSGIVGSGNMEDILNKENEYNPGKRSRSYPDARDYRSLSNFFKKMHMVATKRCANLFDESCMNGGLPGANRDEEWLNNQSPGRK